MAADSIRTISYDLHDEMESASREQRGDELRGRALEPAKGGKV